MNHIFTGNEYHTDPQNAKPFLLRILLKTWLVFAIRFVHQVFKARKLARSGKYLTPQWEKSSYDTLKLVEDAGGKIHITGLDYLRQVEGPVVFISNHMSTMETMIFPCIINPIKKVNFIVKETLVNHPLFGDTMQSRKPILVGRSNSREDLIKVLKEGPKMLGTGTSIIIFPQSTRKIVFNPVEFNSLGIKLALKANCQVIPVAIKTDFWSNGKLIHDLGALRRKEPIHISFGPVLKPSGNGKVEHQKVIDFIGSRSKEWNKHKTDI